MSGIIYFLTNITIPGMVKIGFTEGQLQDRLAQLNSTGVPSPFDVSACFLVKNPTKTEKQIHSILDNYRNNQNREFFELSPQKALSESISIILSDLCGNNGSLNSDVNKTLPNHGQEIETISLLKGLTGCYKHRGYDAGELRGIIDESEIEVENRLVNLKEIGLVDEKKSRKEWQPNVWKITSKGVKFLFDYNLVEEDMLR